MTSLIWSSCTIHVVLVGFDSKDQTKEVQLLIQGTDVTLMTSALV